jgi:hypothetical protein
MLLIFNRMLLVMWLSGKIHHQSGGSKPCTAKVIQDPGCHGTSVVQLVKQNHDPTLHRDFYIPLFFCVFTIMSVTDSEFLFPSHARNLPDPKATEREKRHED